MQMLTMLAIGGLLLAGAELAVLGNDGADESPGTSEALVSMGRAVLDRMPSRSAWRDANHAVLLMPERLSREK